MKTVLTKETVRKYWECEPRPDTGLTNGQLGLGLGMAAQLMLLGSLLASYVLLEVGAAPGAWPAVGQRGAHPLMAGVPLLLLVGLMCGLMVWRRAPMPAHRPWLMAMAPPGMVALALTALDWSGKLATGHTSASHTYFATWFILSGVVSLQLLAGLVAWGSLMLRTGGSERNSPLAIEWARLISGWWIFSALSGGVAYGVLLWL